MEKLLFLMKEFVMNVNVYESVIIFRVNILYTVLIGVNFFNKN